VTAPLVSVIVPVYEEVAWLDEALDSVAAQTMDDFEVVVADDGSASPAARAALHALDRPRTRVLRLPHGGVCRARNRAVAESRGRLLTFFDADDRMHPRFLERLCGTLEANPDLAFASPWVRLFGDEEWEWRPARCDLPALLGECTVATAALVRREDVLAVGGFDERMELGHEDWDLWLSIVERGRAGAIVPEVLFDYRRRAGSRSAVADHGETYLALFADRIAKHAGSYRRHLFEVLWEKEVTVGHLLYDLLSRAERPA
jgi:glycosyltransferase involved in cell wall biosynthesis